jgi:NADH-quinone oxidoreductase subunit E
LEETDLRSRLQMIFSRFNGTRDELIPLMEAAQDEFGYLSEEVMAAISRFLKVPEGHVFGVATFYALFRLKPGGKKNIRVCRGTACHVRGGSRILQEVENQLGIKAGQTTPDRYFSLETISCFGSCALAPVLVVDKNVYGRVTVARVEQILKENRPETQGSMK